jgi:predicted transcriptional regulator
MLSAWKEEGSGVKRYLVATFKPHGEGLAKIFGSLEADIVELIWVRQELSARDVFEALRDQGHRLSYGAVRTVLDRLVKKQVLTRTLDGNQYLYRATHSREEFTNSAVGEIIDSLMSSFGEPVYAQFLDRIQAADDEQLERLAQLINAAEERRKHKP